MRLYRFVNGVSSSGTAENQDIGASSHFKLVDAVSGIGGVRCMASSYQSDSSVAAVAFSNGRIQLYDVNSEISVVKEFAPNQARQALCLEWNPILHNLLACGLEKVRGDMSIKIWDVNSIGYATSLRPGNSESRTADRIGSLNVAPAIRPETVVSPLLSLLIGENCHDISWNPDNPSQIAVTTGYRSIRFFDTRSATQNTAQIPFAHSRNAWGLSFDPFNGKLIASHGDDGIKVWDLRKDSAAVYHVRTQKLVSSIRWSPTRKGLLVCVCKDDDMVRLWNLQDPGADSAIGTTDDSSAPPNGLTSIVTIPFRTFEMSRRPLQVEWHPHNPHVMAVLCKTNSVELVRVPEEIPISLSSRGYFTVGAGDRISMQETLFSTPEVQDIAEVMRRRARLGYDTDVARNAGAVSASDLRLAPDVAFLWRWMILTKKVASKDLPCYHGLGALYSNDSGISDALDPTNMTLAENENVSFPVYESSIRSAVLKLCGWYFSSQEELAESVRNRVKSGSSSSGAMLALLNLQWPLAISTLASASEESLRSYALSLAGFSSEKKSPWHQMANKLADGVSDAYLRACFLFLGDSKDNILSIVAEEGIALLDRIAVAVKYMGDKQLKTWLSGLASICEAQGDLTGVVFTGLSATAIPLFSNYVNKTGDVQTVALTFAHVFPKQVEGAQIRQWITSYRDFLDQCELWHERAKFDVQHVAISGKHPPPQVYARCQMCGGCLVSKSYSGKKIPRAAPITSRFEPVAGADSKPSACPHCSRPLPRCSICLLPVGSSEAKGEGAAKSEERLIWESASSGFSHWMTWCQNCHHGGHAQHLLEWFELHQTCPVADCPCNCMNPSA